MDTLTPEKLIDTLNKNYPKIIEHAINGYKKIYDIEQEFISKINKDISINNLLNNNETKKQLAYLILYANVLQYGKSYFSSQIVYNFIQMNNLTDYVNIIGLLLNNEKKESGVTIEELPEEIYLNGGKKGGQSFAFFLKFVSILIITAITNVTSIGTAISPLTDVSVSLDIENKKIPKAIGYQGELDPGIEEELMKFTQQYKQPLTFPSDKIITRNVTTLSKEILIKNITKSMSFMSSLFMTKEYLDEKITEAIRNETRRINLLTEATTLALEELCKSFVRTTDPSLPIPLYVLLNSKMASKFEELQEKRKKIVEQKESQLKQKKIEELQITAPEPGLGTIVKEEVVRTTTEVFSSISGMFSWPSASKESLDVQTTSPKVPSPSAQQISEAYYEVEKAVADEIESLSNEIDVNAFQELARDVMTDLGREASEALSVTNLRIYLSSICQIKRPVYIFNQTDNLLYIKDPARSRTHLKVLAQNVVSYYETVTQKGLQRIEDGEVITDIPSEERQINMKSLLEKSQVIIEILTAYDTGLSRTLLDLPEEAEVDYLTFFENIAKMWVNLKTQTIEGLAQFPMEERKAKIERDRQTQATILAIQNEMQRHESEKQMRLQILAQNQELNNLTESEWNILNQWFSINTGGVLKMGTGVINNVVNSTTDMGNNLIDNSKKLADNGMSGILSLVWGIAYAGMILSIPAIIFISIKTGYITAYFTTARRRLENQNIQNQQPDREAPLAIEAPDGQVVDIGPLQSNQLTIMPGIEALLNAAQMMEGDAEYVRNTGLEDIFDRMRIEENRGGKIRRHKKTRKNKKRKTRKLKHGKRHQTRNKKYGKTKRH